MTSPITLSPMREKAIPIIVDSFAKASWPKPASTFYDEHLMVMEYKS